MYGLQQITAPAFMPVTLDEAKAHLRVDGTAEDDLILSCLIAASEYVQRASNRQLITATWEYSFGPIIITVQPTQSPAITGAWPLVKWYPSGTPQIIIPLPRPPLVSVTSVKYYTDTNTQLTLDPSSYRVGTATDPGQVVIFTIPTVYEREDAITVRYVAGYGNQEDVPEVLKVAIKMMVGHFYANREAIGSNTLMQLPLGVERLIDSVAYRGWL